jgi:hypothetical protein
MSGPIILVGLRGVDQARENGWIKLVRSDTPCAVKNQLPDNPTSHQLFAAEI